MTDSYLEVIDQFLQCQISLDLEAIPQGEVVFQILEQMENVMDLSDGGELYFLSFRWNRLREAEER